MVQTENSYILIKTVEIIYLYLLLDCCSIIKLTLGNSLKDDSNIFQDFEGVYTFSGHINGMDYFVHSTGQFAIWYYVGTGANWLIGNLTNLGSTGGNIYTHSKELFNKCPMNNGYVWSWMYRSSMYSDWKDTNEVYAKCMNEDDFCTSENPCGQDQGDCDTHDECQDGFACGTNNCPASAGMSSDMDCCSVHAGCKYH